MKTASKRPWMANEGYPPEQLKEAAEIAFENAGSSNAMQEISNLFIFFSSCRSRTWGVGWHALEVQGAGVGVHEF